MAKITIGMNPAKVAAAESKNLAEQQERMPWTPERTRALHEALEVISGSCDGAREEDGVGFSRDDADAGHYFASSDWRNWDSNDITEANAIARKYRFTQIPRRLAHRIWPIEFPYDDRVMERQPGDEKLVRPEDGPDSLQWGELFGRARVEKEDR